MKKKTYDAYCPNCHSNNGEYEEGEEVRCVDCGWRFIN